MTIKNLQMMIAKNKTLMDQRVMIKTSKTQPAQIKMILNLAKPEMRPSLRMRKQLLLQLNPNPKLSLRNL
jgi:hypothetical protein